MKARTFDRKFDAGEDMSTHVDWSNARRPSAELKRVNVDFPRWVIEALDQEAQRLGVTRQSLIKLWIAERLDRSDKAA
ncbi:MAG TPA: CopG family transcriptional regulator [Methylocystis sp.]|nr:CopG family transcriptional regulator [Methylocystis sp.]